MIAIKDGDFVVLKESYRIEVRQVFKVTAQLLFYRRDDWNGKPQEPRRIRRDKVVFSGSESVARDLAELLTSSRARMDDEQRSAYTRRVERDNKIIATAKADEEAGR